MIKLVAILFYFTLLSIVGYAVVKTGCKLYNMIPEPGYNDRMNQRYL